MRLRWVLAVRLEDHRRPLAHQVQAGRQRGLLAEVARELQRRDPRIGLGQAGDHRPGVVVAAVVHIQDVAFDVGHAIQHRAQPRMQQRQCQGLVGPGAAAL
ncbi:hypothetical protein G6F59_015971 [Rhizopus arrhizus]|nr:hypothetical protein G6F59_015971 [Rhizopus arrhizus]